MRVIESKEELREMILSKEDISTVDYSGVTDMSELLKDSDIEEIPHIKMSNVTSSKHMFYGCKKLKKVPKLDTRNVRNAQGMFCWCLTLEEVPEMDFRNASNIAELFSQCRKLKKAPKIHAPKAKLLVMTFMNCFEMERLEGLVCEGAEVMHQTFYNCRSLKKIANIQVPMAYSFIKCFKGCHILEGDLSAIRPRKGAKLNNMFDKPEELISAFGEEETRNLIRHLGGLDAFAAKAILKSPENHLERFVARKLLKNEEYFE